ncbi:MAG: cell division protein FtsQ/DivIB [Cellvibrionaceae bacterium]
MNKKSTTRKNTRKKNEKKSFSFVGLFRAVKVATFVAVISSVLGASAYYGSQSIKQFLSKPIASVLVSGDFNYLAKDEVVNLINDNIQKSFVRESLENMRDMLEANPWVDQVSLRRQWPDRLHVNIVEQKPIARWGDSGFVNYRGELVKTDQRNTISHLPRLDGVDGEADKLMRQYQLLSQMLANYDIKIIGLTKSTLGLWHVGLDNGWQLKVGRNDVAKKVQQLMYMLATNQIERQQEIEVVDLRYNKGIAVQWKEYKEHAQIENKQKI